ncbi:EAL domain-containing protein [Geodermatophilaceae bacterium NBWT11]|nr:EAL domain-containing protein [Geodermatophilaceae bacterium NBWT11]
MTTGPRASVATTGSPSDSRLRRATCLVLLAAAATLAAGRLPGATGTAALVTLTFGGLVASAVACLRLAGRSGHPAVWRWYAAATLATTLGSGLVQVVSGDAVPPTAGALPGMLLALVPVALLIPAATWRGLPLQLASSLSLFVVACLLCLLTVFVLFNGGDLDAGTTDGATLYALGIVVALTTGVSLLLTTSSTGPLRRVALVVLAAQLANALASSIGALREFVDPAATDPPAVACAVGVLGFGLLAVAALADRSPAPTVPADVLLSPVGALLPHATALVGGTLLLVSVLVTGELSRVGVVLGVVGLALLVLHQAVAWRDHRALTADLTRSEAYFRTVVRSSVDPVVVLDDQLRVAWASSGVSDLLGRDADRAVGHLISEVVHPDDAPGLFAGLRSTAGDEGPEGRTRTARLQHRDGSWRLIQARVRDLRADPDVGALVLYCRDVSGRRGTDGADVALVTATDPVTGLPTRPELVQRLATLLRDRPCRPTALVKIGVSGLGERPHPAALVELTARFARLLRGDDWLVRSGTGEFSVLVAGSVTDAEAVAHRLTGSVDPDTPLGGLRLSAAAGIATLEDDADAGDVLRRAGTALTSARAAGPGRVRRHSVALLIAQNRRDALRRDLEVALERDELRLVYQPIVDLALHRTVSVEALLRWSHPTWGEVSPAEFVPLAEESALVVTLGRWVLGAATRTVAALPTSSVAVAVNVSARHVRSGELLTDVLTALEDSGLPASRLTLELTESVVLDDVHVADELLALHRLGVRIAVDDFGTGWSSLAYLVGLPIDVLKMDRQFLADIEHDRQRRALCRSVLHLGSSLGMDVVVEGVETPAELQLLRDMGHRFVQGFLLARPLEAVDLPDRVARNAVAPTGLPS